MKTKENITMKGMKGHEVEENKKPSWPVLCAWCEAEGVKTILKLREKAGSHGICKMHSEHMIRQYKETKHDSDARI